MIYAVIDTNVLVSSLLSKNPTAATVKVITKMIDGLITPVYNEEEYTAVLHRKKFRIKEEDIQVLLGFITEYGIHTDRIPYEGDMSDEKDRPFYEVSLSLEDSFLVTGNLKHFPHTPKVITPAELIEIMEQG